MVWSQRAVSPTKMRFDAEVFSWLRGFEEEWLPRVAEATERLGSRRCVELTYEDDLLDERKQARTLERLRRAFHLDLNLEALSLQKLRRISAGGGDAGRLRQPGGPHPGRAGFFIRRASDEREVTT